MSNHKNASLDSLSFLVIILISIPVPKAIPWLMFPDLAFLLSKRLSDKILARYSEIKDSQKSIENISWHHSGKENCGDFISYLATLCAYFQWDRCKPLPLHVGYHCNRHIPLYRHISVNACPCLIILIISG